MATPRPGMPRRERREQLLDLTLALILEQGFDAVSMQAVAAAADIGKPVVYRSFPSASALLGALLLREQRRADRALRRIIPDDPGDRHPREVLLGALEALIEAVLEHPLTWRLVLLPPEGTPAAVRALVERRRATVVRRTRRLVAWGLPSLALADPPDEDLMARALVSAAQELARIVLEEPARAEAALAAARTLLGAVAWRDA